MKTIKLITITILACILPFSKAKSQDVVKVLVLSPSIVMADDETMEYLNQYEDVCLKPYIEEMKLDYQSKLEENNISQNQILYYQHLTDFINTHNYKNHIAYTFADSWQRHQELNKIVFLPVNDSIELTIPSLSQFANKEGAELVVFLHPVQYQRKGRKITVKPSLYLYDNIEKKIIFKPTNSSNNDYPQSTTTSIVRMKKYTIEIKNSFDFSIIQSTIDDLYR